MEQKPNAREAAINFIVKAIFNFICEMFGTATYMFIGCLGCVFGSGNTLGISLAFGFAVMTGIEIALQVSGAHLNPIVTVSAMFFRKLSILMGVVYIIAQFCGALLGYGLVKALTPAKFYHERLCCTVPHPDLHLAQAVFIEFVGSAILVLMVCAQWHPRNTRLDTISIRVGFTLFCLFYAIIPLTGGSLNPARSFGPAVWTNTWKHHWVYWVAPISASLIWAPIYYHVIVKLGPKDEKEGE